MKVTERPFDVFLAHSSKDKPLIQQIYRKLKDRGLKPWLDIEEIAPGTSFQDQIQQAIGQIKTAAVCIGQTGLGPWQTLELQVFISQCVERKIPVIPVLLPGVGEIPENLLFLRQYQAVVFRNDIEDEQTFDLLEWGITGRKPRSNAPVQLLTLDIVQPGQVTPDYADDKLNSEKGVDYTQLRDLLKAGNWKAADDETYKVMIQGISKKLGDGFTSEELLTFPHTDLQTIDRLWMKYSKGKFGFSVQKQIYVECGAKLDGQYPGDNIWNQFGSKIGWQVNGEWISHDDATFSMSAPKGHLPPGVVVGMLSLLSHPGLGSRDDRQSGF
ncbi:GUN4 domain-containing protein [Cyanobacteria bacterium FACHB-471]|nr:GUN4 domain-containing protein [Cyanobacteria bacterium FACHB-471]